MNQETLRHNLILLKEDFKLKSIVKYTNVSEATLKKFLNEKSHIIPETCIKLNDYVDEMRKLKYYSNILK